MEGGKIVRTIGGESIKRATRTLTFIATNGDLTFNAATQVQMIGEKNGVKHYNGYTPPPPLEVVNLEGPFNEQGEKVRIVEKGKTYKFKITQFNREVENPIELKSIRWSVQYNQDSPMPIPQVTGKQEVTMDLPHTHTSEKITIYAYLYDIEKEGKTEAHLKTKTGGINTRFYDEQGQQTYEIPQKLHKTFNEEYGIKLAYDKEQEMLYYEGDCPPAYEKVSPTAIEHWKRELNPEQTSKGKLLFGYNFGYEAYLNGNAYDRQGNLLKDFYTKQRPINRGIVPGYRKVIKNYKHEDGSVGDKTLDMIGDIACIDLGDFDENLVEKGTSYELNIEKERYQAFKLKPPIFTNRYSGLPRVLEHEFIGHVLLKLTDKRDDLTQQERETLGPVPTEAKLGNVIRREIGLPDRINYGGGSKMNSRDDDANNIKFGYMNGNNRIPHPDADYEGVNRNSEYGFFGPPPKYPTVEGHAIIKEKDYPVLQKVNYVVKIKFDGANETFDFS